MRGHLFLGLSVLASLVGAGMVRAQSGAGQAVAVSGSCRGLTVFGADWTPTCVGSMQNVIHANGVQSLIFSAGDRALVTFIGRSQTMVDGGRVARLRIDGVQVIPMQPGARPAEFRAVGECRFSDPFKGPMRTTCTAAAPQGRFAAEFMTDGSRPSVRPL